MIMSQEYLPEKYFHVECITSKDGRFSVTKVKSLARYLFELGVEFCFHNSMGRVCEVIVREEDLKWVEAHMKDLGFEPQSVYETTSKVFVSNK